MRRTDAERFVAKIPLDTLLPTNTITPTFDVQYLFIYWTNARELDGDTSMKQKMLPTRHRRHYIDHLPPTVYTDTGTSSKFPSIGPTFSSALDAI